MAHFIWKKLKEIDAFKSPVNLMLHRRSQTNKFEKINNYKMGSKIGGISTLIIYLVLLLTFVGSWVTMYTSSKDIISR